MKERIGKGIAAQTTYFEREAMRLDRDVATQVSFHSFRIVRFLSFF